jgi:pilus assembly protein FimV
MHKRKIVICLSAAMLLLAQTPAYSAGLGKLSINSALGQPLNAEIDVIAADPSELATMQARMASADAFHDANVDMSSTLSGIKFALDKKPDGHTVIKITSKTPVNDPFLDMLIELSWGSGQMVREYTLLLDPPGMTAKQNSNLSVTPATVGSSASATSNPLASGSTAPTEKQAAPETKSAVAKTAVKKPAETSTEHTAENGAAANGAASAATIGPVKSGATLIAIAKETKPEGVKLEQMLVGLYRANTHAFVGNMNRLKVGQIMKVPTKEEVSAISEADAAREIKLQSADWNSYRQKLAGEVAAAPKAEEKPAQVSGKITSKVEDKAAQAKTGQDVLKLSKGEAPATGKNPANGNKPSAAEQKQAAQDEAAAKQNALKEANDRAAALEKNIKDMQRLVELKNQSMAELQKNAEKPAATPPAPVPVPPVATPPAAPAKPAPKKVEVPPAAPIPATSNWYEAVNPLYAGAGAIAVLLLAFMGFRAKSRRRREGLAKFENSIMTNVEAKPNTVYGTQGGASVNTNNTSFLTDFSQSGLGNLDTHDVDPIAEAEVYMAYGRDAQAEEILKEAMVKDPARHEIKLKLLEIYAARNNLPAFESIATELYSALGGENTPIWEKAAELGHRLDPHNPLYGGHSAATGGAVAAAAVGSVAAAEAMDEFVLDEEPETAAAVEEAPAVVAAPAVHDDQGLDFSTALDFDTDTVATPVAEPVADMLEESHAIALSDIDAEAMASTAAVEPEPAHSEAQVAAEPAAEANAFADMDFNLDFEPESEAAAEAIPEPIAVHEAPVVQTEPVAQDDMLSFDFDLDDSAHEEPVVAAAPAPAPADEPEEGPVTLDFSGIHLDFEEPSAAEKEPELSEVEQEVKTKLDLAQVYQEMGDHENAREILQEVIKEGNAQQQAHAQELLDQLG